MRTLPLVLFACALFSAVCAQEKAASPLKHKPATAPKPLTSAEMRDIAFDFLYAMSDFYLSTLDEGNSEDVNEITVMTTLMNRTNELKHGITLLSKYKAHRTEAIRVAAKGSIIGAQLVQAADSDLLSALRSQKPLPPEEFRYRVATYISKQEEGYSTIAKSAPWITVAMFTPKEKEERVGPIAYTISPTDRKQVLETIDRMFGAQISADQRPESKDNHNLIVVAVELMKRNLAYETYEEAMQAESAQATVKP